MSDAAKLQNRLKAFALEEGLPIESLFDFDVIVDKAADDGTAATTTADTKVWTNCFDFPCQIVAIAYSATGGGITADVNNYAQIQAKADDGLGGATAVGAQLATQPTANGGTGNIAANVGVQAVGKLTGAVVPVNGNVFFAIAKQGTGVVVRAGKVCIRLRRI